MYVWPQSFFSFNFGSKIFTNVFSSSSSPSSSSSSGFVLLVLLFHLNLYIYIEHTFCEIRVVTQRRPVRHLNDVRRLFADTQIKRATRKQEEEEKNIISFTIVYTKLPRFQGAFFFNNKVAHSPHLKYISLGYIGLTSAMHVKDIRLSLSCCCCCCCCLVC